MKYLSVLPKELGDEPQNTIGVQPIGTGPFYVKAWMQNLKMVLRKHPCISKQIKMEIASTP